MEQTTQQTNMSSPKKKNIGIVVAIVIVILLALAWWQMKNTTVIEEPQADVESGALAPTPTPLEDTTPVIQQDLQGIDNVNLDKELESINADLNNL